MNETTKKTAAPKPPKKLVPRNAPKPEAAVAEPVPVTAAPAPEAAPVNAAPAAKPARKPTRVQETVAKHQKVLAEALVKAQAIKYDQPKVMKQAAPAQGKKAAKDGKPEKAVKVAKVAKPRKLKLVRDSYAMPEAEYARIGELKKRMAALGSEVKKSELLRAGIATLAALNDAELKAVMARVERIKTGRPAK